MEDAAVPMRVVTELELQLRSLIPQIQQAAATGHRGHHGAALRRAGMHEAAELVREHLDVMFGPRDRVAERALRRGD